MIKRLALDNQQFLATFYARQKEVESFATTSERLRNIKKLLGLTHLQRAAEIARADLKTKTVIVGTLADAVPDVAKAEQVVSQERESVDELEPAIAAAAARRSGLVRERGAAWDSLAQAEADAESLQAARGESRLAREKVERARADVARTAEELDHARQAQIRVDELGPAASKVTELQSVVGQFELRKQANEHYPAMREARADAQRRLARAQDELDGVRLPDPPSAEVAADLAATEDELSRLTDRLIADQQRAAHARQLAAAAVREQRVAARANALRDELAAMPEVERELADGQAALADMQGQLARVELELAEETQHAQDVRRDGPDAKCLRCRRSYGQQYSEILAEFEATVDRLSVEQRELDDAVALRQKADVALSAQLAELRRKEGELESLPAPEHPLQDPKDLEIQLDELNATVSAHGARRSELIGRIEMLRENVTTASMAEASHGRAADLVDQLDAEMQRLGVQLEQQSTAPYDSGSHQGAVNELELAREAETELRRLAPIAQGVELCERRRAAAGAALDDAEAELARRAAALEALSAAVEPLDEARVRVEELTEQWQTAEARLAELGHEQVRRVKDVEAAEGALRTARREQRRLRAAQLDMQVVQAAADGLAEYALGAQRRAIPRLEQEMAELLARLSGGAYTDVRLDDRAAVTVLDAGEHRPLGRFSGGEQDLAHLCLRLALSRTFAASRGTEPGLIILDEVFGSQDLERRATLFEYLGRLEDEFEQVFVISHFDDVTARCDVQFEVRKTRGVSEVLPV